MSRRYIKSESDYKAPSLIKRDIDDEIFNALVTSYSEPDKQSTDTKINTFLKSNYEPLHTTDQTDNEIALFIKQRAMAPWLANKASGEDAHVGIDTEYVYNEKTGRNDVLSYQYYVYVDGHEFSCIELTEIAKTIKKCRAEGMSKEDELIERESLSSTAYKLNFDKFISGILQEAKDRGFIENYPKNTYIYAHFMRADIASFEEFWDIGKSKKNGKHSLEVMQNTVSSGRNGYGLDLASVGRSKYKLENTRFFDRHNNAFETKIRFIDTMLLAPNKASLASCAELIGMKKETIPAPYHIEKMDDLLVDNETLFNRYAILDAEIALKYGLAMQDFALKDIQETTGIQLNRLPTTLGNISVSIFKALSGDKSELDEILGMETVKKHFYNPSTGVVNSSMQTRITPGRRLNENIAIDCFHGGRNEAYTFGPTAIGDYNDFDLAGAYTTALVDVLPADFKNAYTSRNIQDYLGHVLGFAYVSFKFSESTSFPSIPVRTDLYGLYYPSEGKAYVTAPELQVAHDMGCEIDIEFGTIVPWVADTESMFKEFTALIREQRNKCSEAGDKFKEQLWKTIGNTLYGKIGQGLKGKRGFDSKDGRSKEIPHSPVTNPYYAAHATGFVRAVMSEMLAKTPEDVIIISGTTDGYLTDSTQEQLDISGPISQRFNTICDAFEDGGMIKLKHNVKQLIGMKTRGQLTAELGDSKPVIAKAGIQAPRDRDENEFMVELFLDREPGQKVASKSLTSARDMWLKEMDLITIHSEKKLNLEFDFKRKPMNPHMAKVRHPISNQIIEHLAFSTVPWKNEQEGQHARATFDAWRVNNCLKTMVDWNSWVDFYKVKSFMKGTGIKYKELGSLGILKLLILRAIMQSKWGLPEQPKRAPKGYYIKLAEQFTGAGFPTTAKDCANSKGRKVLDQVLPATPNMMPLLAFLTEIYPELDLSMVFHPDELTEAMKLLKEYKSQH